jgi:hypothetical protein
MSDIKICVAIPAYDTFHMETVGSLVSAFCELPYKMELRLRRGSILHRIREQLIDDAIEMQASHVMFIDTDMAYHPHAIQILIDRDKDIIAAACHTKEIPPKLNIKFWDKDNPKVFANIPEFKLPTEPFKVAAIGTGFMLINLKRLLRSKFQRPFFDYSKWPNGDFIGEDIYFCLEAQKAGLEVWCDPTVDVGHIGLFVY